MRSIQNWASPPHNIKKEEKMKKLLTLLFVAAFVITAIVSCDITSPNTTPKPNSGDFKAILNPDIFDEALDEFMDSYSRYGLKIVASLQPDNRFRFVFNKRTIDKHTLLDILKEDCRIKNVDFNEVDLVWLTGTVAGKTNKLFYDENYGYNEFIDEMIQKYAKWDLRRTKYALIDLAGVFGFDFNPDLVCDFEVLRTLRNYPIVEHLN